MATKNRRPHRVVKPTKRAVKSTKRADPFADVIRAMKAEAPTKTKSSKASKKSSPRVPQVDSQYIKLGDPRECPTTSEWRVSGGSMTCGVCDQQVYMGSDGCFIVHQEPNVYAYSRPSPCPASGMTPQQVATALDFPPGYSNDHADAYGKFQRQRRGVIKGTTYAGRIMDIECIRMYPHVKDGVLVVGWMLNIQQPPIFGGQARLNYERGQVYAEHNAWGETRKFGSIVDAVSALHELSVPPSDLYDDGGIFTPVGAVDADVADNVVAADEASDDIFGGETVFGVSVHGA